MKPFQNESEAVQIGGAEGLNIENRLDAVCLYGNLDITKDRRGLAHARLLQEILTATVFALENEEDLPETIETGKKAGTVKNPFSGA